MKPKYLLKPGWIKSANDGDKHYIGPYYLASLYGVSMQECTLSEDPDVELIPLRPRYDGNYTLPGPIGKIGPLVVKDEE